MSGLRRRSAANHRPQPKAGVGSDVCVYVYNPGWRWGGREGRRGWAVGGGGRGRRRREEP